MQLEYLPLLFLAAYPYPEQCLEINPHRSSLVTGDLNDSEVVLVFVSFDPIPSEASPWFDCTLCAIVSSFVVLSYPFSKHCCCAEQVLCEMCAPKGQNLFGHGMPETQET